MSKPKKRYGWSEKIAEDHEWEMIKEDLRASGNADPVPEDNGGKSAKDAEITEGADQTPTSFRVNNSATGALSAFSNTPDGLPQDRPGGRLEEIMQFRARAPITESPWAIFAAQVVRWLGVRRAVPSNKPGEIRVGQGIGDGYDDPQTVYIGPPLS